MGTASAITDSATLAVTFDVEVGQSPLAHGKMSQIVVPRDLHHNKIRRVSPPYFVQT
jgi:hypothetical protein